MQRLAKTDVPGYFKDLKTGAILNQNHNELQHYKSEIAKATAQKRLEDDVEAMKKQMDRMMELLTKLLDK